MNTELTRKVIRCAIVGMLFLAMITLQGVFNQRESHQIIFMLAVISLFSLVVKNVWITLFLLWTVFLFSFFKFTTGNIYLTNIFLGSVFYLVTKSYFKKEHIDFFINGFLWFVCFNIFYMAIQSLGLDFIYTRVSYVEGFKRLTHNIRPEGFMGHLSIMGTVMAFAVPLLATRGSKMAWIGALGLFVPLCVSKTSLCFVMGAVGLLFVLFYKLPRKIFIAGILIFLLSFPLYLAKIDKIGKERFVQWYVVLKDAMIHPVTGWGMDSFANVTPQKDFRYMQQVLKYPTHEEPDGKIYTNITAIAWWDNPHNLYISLLYEFGSIGLFLFCGYIRQNVLRFKNSFKDSNVIGLAGSILVFLGISLGHFPIFLARMAVFIIPAFALFEVATSKNNE